ncbi:MULTISPECIES: diacylglycerol kinase family protein [Bacillales]|uniref:Diacylglycerol kinase family protein n=1 Tax=Lysinibacillus louembei TaxID=1470088 RepID=A0ABZ0RTM7_9BACI|nr:MULTISPECIES: diacylglycerol kinase family protein [Bacillales]MCT6923327.1 diacylglycerol kinase family protein [Metasolibacillus sp.]MCT6939368.1 diacylglycerol kinase family protein [Metasolibacillus sp.]WPK11559.1 diacylglycerol kinase family protein [Lysinibacillus louembei]
MDIRKFMRSFVYAFQGMIAATKEQNMRFHLISACIVSIAGFFTGLTTMEWIAIVVAIMLVIGAEMINSAIERVVDLATAELHPLAKAAKDIAAGAVLVFAIGSVIIGVLIFFPKWF